ncbi:MAG: hypothetical protein JXQ30_13345 [Spirochaetes bacterium]|nr:hypothetical protein [Spirochaetota bacterium]
MNRRTGTHKGMKGLLITAVMTALLIFSLFFIFSCGAGVDVGQISVYTLTLITDGDGTTSPADSVQITHGVPTIIQAIPEEGYSFLNWELISGTGVVFENPYSETTEITLTSGDATVKANFSLFTYELTLMNDGNGTTNPFGNINVEHGESTDITAQPLTGYRFVSWTVESGSGVIIDDEEAASTKVTLTDGAATIKANFAIIIYVLNITNDGRGTTDPSGEIEVQHGIPTNITATAFEFFGYSTSFDCWDTGASGVTFGNKNSSSTTVTLTGGDATIQAVFDQVESDFPSYTVTPDNHTVTIEWPPVPLSQSYTLYYTTDGSTPSEINGTCVNNVVSPEMLEGISNGYLYSFILCANGPEDSEQWSDVEQAIPLSPLTLAPRVRGGYRKSLLEWNALPGEGTNSFIVLRSEERDGTYTNISGMLTNTYEYTDDDDVTPGKDYFYRIQPVAALSDRSDANSCAPNPFWEENPEIQSTFSMYMAKQVAVKDGYAFIASPGYGLYIVDIDEESPTYLQQTDRWIIQAYDIAIRENTAYLATFEGIKIFDVSDVTDIKELGDYLEYIGFETAAVEVSGDYVYITNDEGLKIIDVSNPSTAAEVGYYDTPWPQGVTVRDNYAFLAGSELGLIVLDISDKTAPNKIGSCDTDSANSVAVDDSYAYIADGPVGFRVVDIQNPSNVTDESLLGTLDTANAQDVVIQGNFAYIADEMSGLKIIDVSVPDTPVVTGWCDTTDRAYGVALEGGKAYVADYNGGMKIIDVSMPHTTAQVGSLDLNDSRGVAAGGSYSYVSDGQEGVKVINISTPDLPNQTGVCDTYNAREVAVSGNFAFIADLTQGLKIIDVSITGSPNQVGSWDTFSAQDVAVKGEYVYLADYSDGIEVIDVSTPDTPVFIDTFDPSSGSTSYAVGLDIQGDMLYVADSGEGLRVIDISDPTAINELGSCDTRWAYDVAVDGEYAYIADGDEGLKIIDISAPDNLDVTYIKGSFTTTNARGVAVSGNYVFLVDKTDGLLIFDVSNPETPKKIGMGEALTDPYRVTINGRYLYVADGTAGLKIIDLLPE